MPTKKTTKSGQSKGTGQAPAIADEGAAPAQKERTNVESSVRLSEEASRRYEEMAEGNASQKTDIFSHAVWRTAEMVARHPYLFRGSKRPWVQAQMRATSDPLASNS